MKTQKQNIDAAIKMAKKIESNYNKLSTKGNANSFFDAWHDIMLCQKECAWQAVDDIEYCYKTKTGNDLFNYVEEYLDQLEKTVKYTNAVIKAQKYVLLIPENIFA